MKPETAHRADEDYVLVDLPVRLTDAHLARLNAAAIGTAQPASPILGPGGKVATALNRAVALVELRKTREAALGADLFGEPAWDILLDLFIQRVEGRRTSATSASIASRAPATTALRYVNMLVDRGLVTKRTSERDLRVQQIELSEVAYRQLLDLLSA